MIKFINKFRKSILAIAALAVLASPVLALASGESYYWQGSSHQAVVGTGGLYTNDVSFQGPAPTFRAPQAVACSSGTGQADLTITVNKGDISTGTAPTTASIAASCDAAIDLQSISIYTDKASAQTAAQTASAPDPSKASCTGGVLSYVLCPIYDFILNSIQVEEKSVIAPFLQISPVSTKANSPPFIIWSQFRNLADIGFIVAFLVIIFGHTLSLGIDSYSLKKTLPRLVMAAILVQFSFILVALGIDIANILGAGVQSLILSPLKGHTTLVINNVNGTIGLAVGIGIAFAAAGSILTGGMLLVLVGAFFAVMAVFLTLVARQILVTLLLIISPLAFVAWILPNTEHLFKLWRTSLVRMLLMYPMIVLLFAAGKLFSVAAIATGGSGSSGAASNAFLPLISVVANVVPLYFIPLTFKYAGSTLNTMSGWINSAANAGRKATMSSQRYEQAKTRVQQRRTELAAGEKIDMGFGVKVGGGQLSKRAARGALSLPGKGSNVRALVEFNKDTNTWKKRLEDENMTYEGVSYLSQGEKWYQSEKTKVTGKISAAQAAGNINEVNVQTEALRRLEEGKQFGSGYSNNTAARSAAMLRRADMDVLSDEDRTEAMDYTGFNQNTQIGRLLGDQLWTRAREGARKTNVHLVFTDSKGNLDSTEMKKYLAKKNSSAWVDYTKDAVEKMESTGVLKQLAEDAVTRKVLENTLSSTGGPSIGAEQQNIIIKALGNTQVTPGPDNPTP